MLIRPRMSERAPSALGEGAHDPIGLQREGIASRVKGMLSSILLDDSTAAQPFWKSAEHDRASLHTVSNLLGTVTAPIAAARDAFSRTLIEPFETKIPEGHRTSFVQKRLLAACSAVAISIGAILHAIRPPDDPLPFAYGSKQFGEPGKYSVPALDTPVHSLYVSLRHPDDLSAFLTAHTEHSYPEGLVDFLSTYRSAPETFLQRRKVVTDAKGEKGEKAHGACNNPSELIARCLWMHGVRPSIGRTRPTVSRLIFQWKWKECHEVVMYRIDGDEYVIFSNDEHTIVRGATPEEALKNFDPNSTVLEHGGIVPWLQTRDNWMARFAHTMGPNQTELPEHPNHRIVSTRTPAIVSANIVSAFGDTDFGAATIMAAFSDPTKAQK